MEIEVDEVTTPLAPGGWRRAVIGLVIGLGLGTAVRWVVGPPKD